MGLCTGGVVSSLVGVKITWGERRYSVAGEENRTDRFAKDDSRKHTAEEPRADSSRRREERGDRQHDHESIRVPKKREEPHVERIPVEEGKAPEEVEVRDDEVLIPIVEEETVVEKRPVVKEVLRVRKDVVEEEETVGTDVVHEKDKHRELNERVQRRGLGESDRRGAADDREGDRDRGVRRRRGAKDQGGPSFIDKAKEALSGEDTGGREGTRTRREDPRGAREDEPPRRRR